MAGSKDSRVDWHALLQAVQPLLRLSLEEDLGQPPTLAGDVTSTAIFGGVDRRVRARLLCRAPTVVCGVPLAHAVLLAFDPSARVVQRQDEGSVAAAGTVLCQWEASLRALLAAERTQLNFLMRLCGIAQAAHAAVQALPTGSTLRVLDTRKTLPGFRLLDKAAVRTGGAHNHRRGLFDAVLIKDNHIAAAGGVGQAVRRVRQALIEPLPIEVEVDTPAQLEEAIAAAPDIILLDNFADAALRAAYPTLRRAQARGLRFEVSGGVTLARLAGLAALGIDRVSMGALTHSVRPPDLSLEV